MDSSIEAVGGPRESLLEAAKNELAHLRSRWVWVLLLGILFVLAGVAAIVVPAATVGTTFAVTIFLGALLIVAGIATIVSSFWVGNWRGFLVQLLTGIVYLACGLIITEKPFASVVAITLFIAVLWIVLGTFRSVGALVIRYPEWGWSLLNGVITLAAGVLVYRHIATDAFWVIGLLVGLEMLFCGWTWIMIAIGLRRLPKA